MCICMIFTLLPFSVFAEGQVDDGSHTHSEANGVVMDKRVEKTGDDTYKVTLEQYVTGTVTQGTVTPIDVVLVLDVSGSMGSEKPEDKISSITYEETYNVTPSSGYGFDRRLNTYYVKAGDGDSYKAVWYCEDCRAYVAENPWNHSSWDWDNLKYVLNHTVTYTPKTSASDTEENHVQFYDKVEGTPITKLAALQNAVNSFIDTIAAKNKDSKIAIVKFAGDKSDTVGNTTYKEGRYTYNHTQIVNNLTAVNSEANVTSLKEAVNGLKAYGSTRADLGLEKAQDAFDTTSATDGHQRVVIMFTDGEPNSQSGFDNDVANGAISAANTLKKSSESGGYDAKVYTIAVYNGALVSDTLPDSNGINRYMHLVSSNYPDATDLGTPGEGNPKGGYYKVATNEKELSDAFTQIGDAVGNPAITLGESAVLTDVVAGNFTAPANANVKVYTADYDGSKFADRGTWTNITSSVTVDVTDQNVTVTGFDYSANFVSDTPKSDGTHGKKLIVEFTIEVDREKTYGGTQPTNAGANIKLGDETVASVADPKVPVAITNPNIPNVERTKPYDEGKGFDVKDIFKNDIAAKVPTNGSKNEHVKIEYVITHKNKDGNTVTDGTYTIDPKRINGIWDPVTDIKTPGDVGEYVYTVTRTISDANTTDPHAASVSAEGTMTFKITPLDTLTVSANGYEGKYDGQAHGGTVNASVEGSTLYYKIDESGEWTTTAPTIKNVDDEINGKTIYVKAKKDNYSDSEVAQYTLTVNPRVTTITSGTASKAYDGKPLTCSDISISGDQFIIDGEVTNIRAIGTVTNVEDSPVNNTIMYDTGANFRAANYNITKNEGTLTIYKATDAKATIKAIKTLNNDAPGNVQFSFKLESTDGIHTATNDADGRIKFDLTYDKEGIYIYKLSEVVGTDTGIVYDGTAYYVQVVVKLNETTQKYEAEVSYFADADCKNPIKTDNPTFNNTTKPGSLTISKTVSGNAADKNKEFTFTLTLSKNGEIIPGEVTYGDLTFKDGKYTFTLKHNGSVTITSIPAGLDYTVTESDNNGYTVTVNGENTATAKGIIKAGETSTAAFKNTKNYVYPPNPPIMDEIIVEITGNSDSMVYDGTEHSVKGYTVKISDPRYTEADFTFTGKAEASGINAGTYEMGLKAEQFKNTNARFTNVKFVIKADGVLTITPKELTITAGSKTEYGPTPVTCGEWTVSGLAAGDKVESVKITGIQSVPGSSPNVPSDAVIKNAKGEDVTKNYAIKYVNGTLTMLEVLNKEDHFNYIIGTPEGLSLPTANVTRAEVATIFFRLMTDDARAKFDSLDNSFSDVAKGKWYNRAISTLANAGIIKGDPAGTYRPGDPITRAEMAAIIARFGDFKEGGKTFNDISGHWAQKYIELAASNGWINGNPDGTFKPNNYITRAETVAMINRVLDRQTKDVSDLLPVSQMTNWSDNMDTAKWYYRDMQEATNNHKAERVGNSIYEKWTEKLPDIDWASYQI